MTNEITFLCELPEGYEDSIITILGDYIILVCPLKLPIKINRHTGKTEVKVEMV